MVIIVDIAQINKMLVEGPEFPRTLMPLKRLNLTRLKVPILRGARHGTVVKAVKAANLSAKWQETGAYKKMQRFTLRR